MSHHLKQNNIESDFEASIKNADLGGLIKDFTEVGIDSVINEGVLRDVPIVGTLASLAKVGANIQDRLFLKKIMAFLVPLQDVDPEKREEIINKIDQSKKYRVKVGEKLLYIIDSCEDFEISELVSKVFVYHLKDQITYDEFLKTSSVLKDMNKIDFDWFIKNGYTYHLELDDVGNLMHIGLFELHYDQVDVRVDNKIDPITKNRDGEKYETEVEGGVSVHLSRAGEILLEIFCSTYKKSKIITL